MTNSLIPQEIVAILTETVTDIAGDGATIISLARHRAPDLFAQATPDLLADFLSRVLERCATSDNVSPASPSPRRDAVLAEEVLRAVARWPRDRDEAAHAWQLALNLVALDPIEHD